MARAQRIVDGQNFEIRQTLGRYAAVVEQQHRLLAERRSGVLSGEAALEAWALDPERRAALAAAVGEADVVSAERSVTLGCIDRAWRDHLALCADVREGVHLVRIGGRDPLTYFTNEAIHAFSRMDRGIDDAVLAALAAVRVVDGRIDLAGTGLKAPTSTWTYLVNDDPFKNRLGALLTGPGGPTLAIYSAAVLMPLFMLWGVVDRLFGRGARRGRR